MKNNTAQVPSAASTSLYASFCVYKADDADRDIIALAVFRSLTGPAGSLPRHSLSYTIDRLDRLSRSLPHGTRDDRAVKDEQAYTAIAYDALTILAAPSTFNGIASLVRELRLILREHCPVIPDAAPTMPILTAKLNILYDGAPSDSPAQHPRAMVTICRLPEPPATIDEESGSYADTVMEITDHGHEAPHGLATEGIIAEGVERLKAPHGIAVLSARMTRQGVAALLAELRRIATAYGVELSNERHYVMRGWLENSAGDARPLTRYTCHLALAQKWLIEVRKQHPRASLACFFARLDDDDQLVGQSAHLGLNWA